MKKFLILLTILFFSTTSMQAVQNWDIQDGIKLVRAENYDEAVRFFEAYVGSFPNDADGHYYLGLTYKNLQDLSKSSFHLTKAYELAKMNSDVVIAPNLEELPDDDYLDMAQVFYESKDFEQALTYIDLAQKVNPDNAYASYLKAHIYYAKKNLDGAKTHLYKALQEDAGYLDTELAKALDVTTIPPYDSEYYNRKGLRYYYGANLVQAKTYFEKAIALDAKNAKVYNNLAMAYAKLGNSEDAKANFKKAIALGRNYSAPYLNLAKLESKQSEMYLKQAQKQNPNDQFVYYALGNYYAEQKDYKNAIKNYQSAIAINSKYFEPYFALAVCYSELEDYKNAMIYVRKASELNNKSAELSYYLAKLCLLNLRPDEALRYMQEAIRKGENPIYYMEMGKIYYSKKDWPAAQNSFYKALELDMRLENEAELYNYLGLCDYKSYDLEGAEYNFKRAVELESKNMMYLYNLAQVYKSNGQKELYNKAIETITASSPKTPEDFLDLSTIYFDRNNTYIALKRINEGIARFPKERKLYEAKLKFYESVGETKAAQQVKDYIKANFASAY